MGVNENIAKIMMVLCLSFVSAGAGYYLRVHHEKSKPTVILKLNEIDQTKHLRRFQVAAAVVADSAHLAPGMDTAIYVYLIERLKHPCPLSDESLMWQCQKILSLAQEMEVFAERPR